MKVRDHGSGEGTVLLTRDEIRKIIPHGDAFLFLESIDLLEPGKRVAGWMSDLTVGNHQDWVEAHFPGYPLVPGAILMEALAQLGAVALVSMPENAGKIAMLGGMRRWRFRRAIAPGEPIRLEGELTRMRGRFGRGELRAFDRDGNVLAEGDMSFAIADKGSSPLADL